VDIGIWKIGLALAVGVALGVWFFGGLWWTVGRLAVVRHRAALMLASFVIRTAGVVAGMIWLGNHHWLLLLAALVGFVAVRAWILSRWGLRDSKPPEAAEG
jgi:F1F0 ATPase subunit 2